MPLLPALPVSLRASELGAELVVAPAAKRINCIVRPPGSKSITNRALLVAALASGASELDGTLFSDDTAAMTDALRTLGIRIDAEPDRKRVTVHGGGGAIQPGPQRLEVRDAGTAARFLPALCALGSGDYLIDGSPRMRERPITPLLEALRQLGVQVDKRSPGSELPIRVQGANARLNDTALAIDGGSSSQYASGLLLNAPYFRHGLALQFDDAQVSRPYIDLTLNVMRAFSANVTQQTPNRVRVEPSAYQARCYDVEPDASSASYFFAAAAITGGRVKVEGLGSDSLQGDLQFVRILERMGCLVNITEKTTEVIGPESLRGVDVDMRDISDTMQTLSIVAAFAKQPTRISGIGFTRGKETDRIAMTVRELRRAGIGAVETDDGLLIYPGPARPARIRTYNDHRMAMSFSLLGLRTPGIVVFNPACVAKTYPDYFFDLARCQSP